MVTWFQEYFLWCSCVISYKVLAKTMKIVCKHERLPGASFQGTLKTHLACLVARLEKQKSTSPPRSLKVWARVWVFSGSSIQSCQVTAGLERIWGVPAGRSFASICSFCLGRCDAH